LYGPPGTGKTMLARAVAIQLAKPLREESEERRTSIGIGGTFLELHASDIVRSEIGNSEKRVVAAFATARARAPSVIFIDEFQALFTSRNSSSSSLASTLLQCMDDIYAWEQSDRIVAPNCNNISRRIVVMGATNTPWMIDKAFLRSGRFDKVVHVGLPDQRDRQSILMVHIQRMRLHDNPSWNHHLLCETLSHQTEGFSGADLAALCRSAAVRCLNEYGDNGMVKAVHFHQALQFDCTASTNKRLVDRLLHWKQ
jgi:SpoVK/Ycf46/Vps4 family AAA+-type ATPase